MQFTECEELDMENNLNMVQSYNSTQLQNALSMLEPYMVLTQNNNRRFRSGTRLALSENFDDVSLKRDRKSVV